MLISWNHYSKLVHHNVDKSVAVFSPLFHSCPVIEVQRFDGEFSNSGSFSTFETSLSQLPSCYVLGYYSRVTIYPTSCIASPIREIPESPCSLLPESVGSIAGSSPEFNPCFEVTGVSIGGKKTKQQLLDFRIFFFLKVNLEAAAAMQRQSSECMRPRSGRQ